MKIGDKYKWLLLDADDTVFDFKKCEYDSVCSVFAEAGYPLTDEDVREYSEINVSMWKLLEQGAFARDEVNRRCFDIYVRKKGYSLDPAYIAAKYEDRLSYTAHLLPGASEACRLLSEKYELCFITNGLKSIQSRRIHTSPVTKYFKHIFISGEIGHGKPSKMFFDAVSSGIPEFEKKGTLIVGDSMSSDITGGIEYGIDTCWINPKGIKSELKTTYEIAALSELPGLLENIEEDNR